MVAPHEIVSPVRAIPRLLAKEIVLAEVIVWPPWMLQTAGSPSRATASVFANTFEDPPVTVPTTVEPWLIELPSWAMNPPAGGGPGAGSELA